MSVVLVIAPSLEASFRANYSVYAGLRQLQQQITLLLSSNPALADQPTTISACTVSPNSPVVVTIHTPATSAHPGACVRSTLELSTSAHVWRTALAEAGYTLKEQLQLVSVLQHALASWPAPLGESSENLDIAVQAHRRDTRCWKRHPSRWRVLPIVESALIREPLLSDNDMQRLPQVYRDRPPPLTLLSCAILFK